MYDFHSRWFYREENRNHSAYVKYTAEIVMGLAWYWVLYHIWYDTGKLVVCSGDEISYKNNK